MGSTWGNTGRRSWSDGKRQRIESALNGLAAGLIKAAAVERECRPTAWTRWPRSPVAQGKTGTMTSLPAAGSLTAFTNFVKEL